MNKIEILLIILVLTGSFLIFNNIEGGPAIAGLSFLTLSGFYFLGGFIVLNGISFNALLRSSTYVDIGWRKMLWSA